MDTSKFDIKSLQESYETHLKKPKRIQNNLLENEAPTSQVNKPNSSSLSWISQIRISLIYNILSVYFTMMIQLGILMMSMVITNIYEFFFKRQKSVMDENILITGSAGYLGRFLAIEFAKRGGNILLLDCNEEANKKTLKTLNLLGHNKAHAFTVDISNEKQLKNIINNIKKEFGFVSIVIMAAAPRITPVSILDSNFTDDIRKHFDINYMSQVWLIQEFLQSMINHNKGHIVTISSIVSEINVPLVSAYSSFKSAQANLMKSVREELRVNGVTNVHTSVVYPGMLKGGLASDFETTFEINRFMKYLEIESVAENITIDILKNKADIYEHSFMRLVLCGKYLVSPKLIGFVCDRLIKVNENGLKLKPKIY